MRLFRLWMVWTLTVILTACSSPSDKKSNTGNAAAQLVSFEASPREVIAGDPVILSWDAKNVVLARLEDGAGKLLLESKQPAGTFTIVPESSGLYRLIVRGKDGTEIQQQVAVQTRPGEGPAAEFRIEPAEVPVGDPIRLVWETSDTHSVIIRSGGAIVYESDRLLSGSVEIIADQAAVYTLTAKGPFGQRDLAAEVKVKPVILSFTGGSSTPVATGTETSLSWRTRGADELELRTAEGQSWQIPAEDIEVGSIVVPMSASGHFELVARKGEFENVQGHEISLLGAPRINGLVASPSPITEGELFDVTVSWDVEWALGGTLTWDGNIHEISWLDIGDGSLNIQVSTETSIALQVRNHIGTSSATYLLPTLPAPAPSLSGPRRVGPAEVFSLVWDAPGASEIFLYQDGELLDVPAEQISGRIDQQVNGTTTWRLDAKNPAGSIRSTTLVTEIGRPQVGDFASDKIRYGSGAPLNLSWVVDGGVELQVLDSEGAPLAGCTLQEGGGLVGGCTVAAPTELGSYEWTLSVENSEGADSRRISFRVGEGPAVDKLIVDAPYVMLGRELTLTWIVLDDVDGVVPDITIVDNRGETWSFRGTHLEEGHLVVTAEQVGPWEFELSASVPGKAPVTATVGSMAVGQPMVDLTADSLVFDLSTMEPLVLEWTASSATLIEIFPTDPLGERMGGAIYQTTDPAELLEGAFPVVPWGPGQGFQIVATNPAGETAEDIVFIEATGETSNPILDFRVSSNSVPRGAEVEVEWRVWGFDAVPTLTPFLDDAPVEITTTAPFINIRTTGTPVDLAVCNQWTALDEGCQIVNFPSGFTLPFDGSAHSAINVTANGTLGFFMSTNMPDGTYFSRMFPTEADVGMENTQFGIFWGDLGLSSSDPIRYELRNGQEGRHLVFQWSNVSSNTFQAVLWESGAVDYRYAAMSSTGSSRAIGWQDRGLTKGNNLNGDKAAVPGGLANRSWRWFERDMEANGSHTFTVERTTIFSLCMDTPGGQQCERRTVTVQ